MSGLAKAAGLSGAGLKNEAGRFFEGPSRYFSGAVPAVSNGVDSPGGRGLVPYGPTPEQERRLEGLIRTTMSAGQVLKPLEAASLGKRLGLTQDATLKALSNMADSGLLTAYGNAHFSVVLWHPSEKGADRSFDSALAYAHTGVEFVNRDGFRDHAKAIHAFDEAASRFKSLEGRAAQENRRLVEVLRANAALELMRDVTKDLESQLTSRAEEARVAQTLAVVRRVASWLGTAAMAPGALPAIDAALASDLKRLADAVDPAKRNAEEDGTAVAAGVRTMQAVIASLQRSTVPKPAAGPVKTDADRAVEAKAREAGFPLIAKDDPDFKNLNKYGSNLTAKAVEGKLTPLIGRKAELRQMVKTLMRVEKNNPVVIGEKGVGKTKVVEGLAQMIVAGEVPELAGVNIVKLDVTALVAGTQYRGQFEERLKGVMDEAKANKGKVLLFIDELHTIVGLGSASGSQDASQMLKEALSSGDMSLIGATTLEEYRKIEKDGALERRFNPIKLAEPTQEEAIEILEGTKSRFEKKHGVSIPRATSEAAVRLAARYVKSRSLPDSALDLIDDASAEVALQNSEAKAAGKEGRAEVTVDDVATEINLRTGIPAKDLSDDDLASLKRLPEELKTRVIGQDEAVEAVAKAIRRGRLGYREEKAPIGSFMFLGPTGVGKTEFVRVLAKNQFGSEKNIVRIDMSEYQEKHS
ncbi:MAG: ATP-dependent Clp protease ATP-binding subunit, partial [Elusimicrobia bacterium]|nr:ATP-dependent Clp protease ATP-binding subunit [Elusimicrobiota bacterium]